MAFEKHLLVDGANILHTWPELRALLPREREPARVRLAQRLRGLHDGEGLRVTVVFDGRGAELVLERPSGQATFSVVFTPSSLTADDVIERLVGNSADPAACVVASGDGGVRQTTQALGATSISPEELAAWVARVDARHNRQAAGLRRATDREWRRR